MWLVTQHGYFSATAAYPDLVKGKDKKRPHIMVRGRVKSDLQNVIEMHEDSFGEPAEILELPGHDYPYRVVMLQTRWAELVRQMVMAVDYSNFKNRISEVQGHERSELYMKIWGVMHHAEGWLRDRVKRSTIRDKGQGYLAHWARSRGYLDDPRTDEEMNTHYSDRGWEEWLDEDERAAIVMDPPKPKKRRRGKKGRKAR